MKRIGLIGGLSWESTATYYRLLNERVAASHGAWQQPPVLVDSLNFADVVAMQQRDDWSATAVALAESARRLEVAGAQVLGICANTMHANFADVLAAVSIPVVDIRDAIVSAARVLGASSIVLLGTKYLMASDLYSSHLERAGLDVVRPTAAHIDELQSIIYDELTLGVVKDASRKRFFAIADEGRARGGDVVGLCCTEFGMFLEGDVAPWPYIDSTTAHVDALLRAASGS